MHISIIHDIKSIFKNLGHEVDSVCMSGHTWVNGEESRSTDIITRQNWLNIDQELCDNFYKKYKNTLSDIDAFVHSYPPAFALLFEKFNKPIITIACTRFEFPCTTPLRSKWLVDGLNRLYKNKQLIPVANNLFDKKYCEEYTNFEWKYISSLCDYMNVSYKPVIDKFIVWSRSDIFLNNKNIDSSFSIHNPYKRDNNVNYKGIVHIPYNVSIMSAFEQYYMNIPLFVPTVQCLENWIKSGRNVLSEIYFPDKCFKIKKDWLNLSDWYIDSNMPHTIKYESESDLFQKLESTDLKSISEQMKLFNAERKEKIYSQWNSIINSIKS